MNPKYEVEEVKNKELIKLVRMLIDYYHIQGMVKGGGAGRNSRYFIYLQKEEDKKYIVAVAWLHDNTPFRFIAQQYNIPNDRSYFIRRVTKTAPGDHLVNFLNDLSEKLKNDGFEVLWTLGLPDHSNALYKKAGFKLVGQTSRTKHEVYVKYLNK
ncbi:MULTISPECIES: hypothetical protein [Bacteria]|uniref:Uncharacterized protein n=3 Tax=root TaxID=1 RepID=A0A1B3SN22_9VIRU|nr:hypothetical protein [Sulfolobus islandicus]YP_009272978.1 hypothetical protein BHS13_gp26 [Sulfolobus islandicus rudivirus 3]AOG61586.1 hypothetical protein [Sulfolobus islandicus rod-shaped virus 3]